MLAFACFGFVHLDTAAGTFIVNRRVGNNYITGNGVVIAQIFINISGSNLTGSNSTDYGCRTGYAVAAGEDAFLKTGLDAAGITADEFAKNRKNADVQKIADDWKPCYDVAKIQGIPAYVVNGKYLIMTKSIRSIDGMVSLIGELTKK